MSSSREKGKEEEGLLALPGEKWNENQWVGIRYLRTKTRRRNKTNCRCGAAQCGSHKRRFADVTGDFVPRTLNLAVLGAPKFCRTCYSVPPLSLRSLLVGWLVNPLLWDDWDLGIGCLKDAYKTSSSCHVD